MSLSETSRRWRVGDHTRGLVLDDEHGTCTVPVIVREVTRRGEDLYALECSYATPAGDVATRTYLVNEAGRSDSLAPMWPRETQRARRQHVFFPRDVHVPPVGSTVDIPRHDKTVVTTYRARKSVWHIVEADSATGEAFGWCELVPGFGAWETVNLVALEALSIGPSTALTIVTRDFTTHGQRVSDLIN